MKNKLNISELLKDYPSGMELECLIYEDVYFDYVDELNIIHCYIQHETHKTSLTFNQYGTPNSDIKSKCVIFPKGKWTWVGFKKPFKDGDVVATNSGHWIGITTGGIYDESIPTYCIIDPNNSLRLYFDKPVTWSFNRLATEEEKQKLFDAIKANGYKWNFETKTLEKLIEPKFKVGDRIKYRSGEIVYRIVQITEDSYVLDNLCSIPISIEHMYNLVPNKFDINTLKPFESRVLVRDANCYEWEADIFGRYSDGYITLGGGKWKQCIPYKGNEHLLGTSDDCDNYYKNW